VATQDAGAGRAAVALENAIDDDGTLPQTILLVADAVIPFSGAAVEWHAGAEAVWRQSARLRAGFMRTGLPERWAGTLGFGIGAGRFRLDYATVLGADAGAPQIVSLTIRLGTPGASGRNVAPLHSVEVEGDCREEDPGIRPPPP
jgi:hypothetical protein